MRRAKAERQGLFARAAEGSRGGAAQPDRAPGLGTLLLPRREGANGGLPCGAPTRRRRPTVAGGPEGKSCWRERWRRAVVNGGRTAAALRRPRRRSLRRARRTMGVLRAGNPGDGRRRSDGGRGRGSERKRGDGRRPRGRSAATGGGRPAVKRGRREVESESRERERVIT